MNATGNTPVGPEHVLNKVLGFSTGVWGFDFLMQGGIIITDSGLSVLVRGPAGAGKTAFALQVAAGLTTKHAFISIFVSLDTPVAALEETMLHLGFDIASSRSF